MTTGFSYFNSVYKQQRFVYDFEAKTTIPMSLDRRSCEVVNNRHSCCFHPEVTQKLIILSSVSGAPD